jgi:hypothetical protein
MSMQSMLIGQDLRLAGIKYFTKQHFEWDKELIQQEKIKSYTEQIDATEQEMEDLEDYV